jgi:hypothetical protein
LREARSRSQRLLEIANCNRCRPGGNSDFAAFSELDPSDNPSGKMPAEPNEKAHTKPDEYQPYGDG